MNTNSPAKLFPKRIRFDLSYDKCLLLNWEDAQVLIGLLQNNPIYIPSSKDTVAESYKSTTGTMGMAIVDESRIQKDLVEHARDALAAEPEQKP